MIACLAAFASGLVIRVDDVPSIDGIAATIARTAALSKVAHGLTAAPAARHSRDDARTNTSDDKDLPGQRASGRRLRDG